MQAQAFVLGERKVRQFAVMAFVCFTIVYLIAQMLTIAPIGLIIVEHYP